MASICEVCGKGTLAGNNVSHSNRHTKRAWKPNIQQVRAIVNESVKFMIIKNKPQTYRYLVYFYFTGTPHSGQNFTSELILALQLGQRIKARYSRSLFSNKS